jgi:hypothetical protein
MNRSAFVDVAVDPPGAEQACSLQNPVLAVQATPDGWGPALLEAIADARDLLAPAKGTRKRLTSVPSRPSPRD